MISFTKSYQTTDGNVFGTLEQAQRHELIGTFREFSPGEITETQALSAANAVLENKDKIVDILTTTQTSKPKARKVNGGTKTRKPKEKAQPELPV